MKSELSPRTVWRLLSTKVEPEMEIGAWPKDD